MHKSIKSHFFVIALFIAEPTLCARNEALEAKIAQQKQAMNDQIHRIRTGENFGGKTGILKENAQKFKESAQTYKAKNYSPTTGQKSALRKNIEGLGHTINDELSSLGDELSVAIEGLDEEINSLTVQEEANPLKEYVGKMRKNAPSTRNIIIIAAVTLISINLLYFWKKSKKEKVIIQKD